MEAKLQEFIDNYKSVLLSWNDFKGRTRRNVFWKFILTNFAIIVLIGLTERALFKGSNFISGIYSLILFVPILALYFRRLHDIGKSAWWLLLFTPLTFAKIPLLGIVFWPFALIGLAVLLYFSVKDSEPDNLYGPNPKGLIEG